MLRVLLSVPLALTLLACNASARGKQPPPPPAIPDARSPLGSNLTAVTDWSTEWAFVNAFKASRAWISGSEAAWDDGRSVDTDADGWIRALKPGQVARTLMFWDGGISYPAGEWLVTWEGNGALEVWNQTVVSQGDRRVVVRADPARGGIGINVTAVGPGEPLHNIRVLPPGGACMKDAARACSADADCGSGDHCALFQHEPDAHQFHPTFLKSLRAYSVLRFMDWANTNSAATPRFAERAKPSDARFTIKGVPLEVMADLANQLDVDPWICVPDVGEEGWAREAALVLKVRLEPERTVWVEHSNEVWNGMFDQATRAAAQGQRLHLASNPFEAQLRWHARRSLAVFAAFTEVLGNDRVVRVMASQAGNPWVSTTLLSFEDAGEHTDALAIAPYFGGYLGDGDDASRARAMTVDQLLDELEQHAVPKAIESVKEQRKVADKFGVRLVAYEGGQHLVGVGAAQNDGELDARFQLVNAHPRMQAIYRKYLEGWRAGGGTLLMHFQNTSAWGKSGSWGAQRNYDEPEQTAPKRAALEAFARTTKRWW